MRQTKIVATIGPASDGPAVLPKLLRAGTDVVRLNFSHGTYAEMTNIIRQVRTYSKRTDQPVAVLQDLQGPRIRLGALPKDGVAIKRGDLVALVEEHRVNKVTIPEGTVVLPTQMPLEKLVRKGDPILIKDGLVRMKAKSVNEFVLAEVEQGDVLTSHRGMNLPASKKLPTVLTAKDREDLAYGLKQKVDWIALSFVKNAGDVRALRKLLPKSGDYRPKIIAKIESKGGIKNFDAILKEADGIMVARGDLGIELPAEQVPLLQKECITKSMAAGKPVIVATQMLESMTVNPQPTRAEVSDVANAILDGASAVMLSAETAAGNYPVESVREMNHIITQAEASPYRQELAPPKRSAVGTPELIARTIREITETDDIKAVVVMSHSGKSAQLMASERPNAPIIALTQNLTTERQLALVWGVDPRCLDRHDNLEDLIQAIVRLVTKQRGIKKGDRIIIVSGHPTGPHGHINLFKLHTV